MLPTVISRLASYSANSSEVEMPADTGETALRKRVSVLAARTKALKSRAGELTGIMFEEMTWQQIV